MALQLLHGDIEQLRREYMVLFTRGVSITRKLGFSDVIMPGTTQKRVIRCQFDFFVVALSVLKYVLRTSLVLCVCDLRGCPLPVLLLTTVKVRMEPKSTSAIEAVSDSTNNPVLHPSIYLF